MRKFTLLLLMVLPFLGFGQIAVTNGTFDANITGWIGKAGGAVDHSSTEGSVALGALELTSGGGNDRTDAAGLTADTGGNYIVSFKVKGPISGEIQAAFRQGTNTISGDNHVLTTNDWETYTTTIENALAGGAILRIIGAVANVYYIDDVTITKAACAGFDVTVSDNGAGTTAITTVLPCYPDTSDVEITTTPCGTNFTLTDWEKDGVSLGVSTPSITHTVVGADAAYEAIYTPVASGLEDVTLTTAAEFDAWSGTQASTVTADDLLTITVTNNAPKIVYDCAIAPTTWNINKVEITYINETNIVEIRYKHETSSGNALISATISAGTEGAPATGTVIIPLTHMDWTGIKSTHEIQFRGAPVGDPASYPVQVHDDGATPPIHSKIKISSIVYGYDPGLSVDKVDNKDDASISLYPNPVQNVLNINAKSAVSKIEIFNLLGQKVISQEDASEISVNHLSKGVYVTKIFQVNDLISTKRFIKK